MSGGGDAGVVASTYLYRLFSLHQRRKHAPSNNNGLNERAPMPCHIYRLAISLRVEALQDEARREQSNCVWDCMLSDDNFAISLFTSFYKVQSSILAKYLLYNTDGIDGTAGRHLCAASTDVAGIARKHI